MLGAGFDPTEPMKTWRTAWRKLTKEAGLPGLRFHDLRHHSITRLAEAGVPEQTLMSIAGHVSKEMLEHYSHTPNAGQEGRGSGAGAAQGQTRGLITPERQQGASAVN